MKATRTNCGRRRSSRGMAEWINHTTHGGIVFGSQRFRGQLKRALWVWVVVHCPVGPPPAAGHSRSYIT
jgi:hypothetical protein